jgi:hypothetical protein
METGEQRAAREQAERDERARFDAQRGDGPQPGAMPYREDDEAEQHEAGTVVWDGDTAGIVVGYDADGTALVGKFASVEATGATLANERPLTEAEAAEAEARGDRRAVEA